MTRAQQTIVNRKDGPIYVSIEVNPECYELEPGECLTLSYEVPARGDALEIHFINENELVIWPSVREDWPDVSIDGRSAEGRSWNFRHHP